MKQLPFILPFSRSIFP